MGIGNIYEVILNPHTPGETPRKRDFLPNTGVWATTLFLYYAFSRLNVMLVMKYLTLKLLYAFK